MGKNGVFPKLPRLFEGDGYRASGFQLPFKYLQYSSTIWFQVQRKVLGIILTYMRSPCYEHNISMTFGTTRSATNRYINAGLRLLRTLMSTHPSSRVLWPTPVEMAAHAEAIARKKPVLRNTGLFGFVDGFRLSIKNFKCEVDQNAYYNYHEGNLCWEYCGLHSRWVLCIKWYV